MYFTAKELACPCCGVSKMEPGFVTSLEKLRQAYGHAIVPNSVYRCAAHNKAIGGADHSQHLLGMACDIPTPSPALAYQLVKCAMELGLTVIVYDDFVHVDGRSGDPLLLRGSVRKWL